LADWNLGEGEKDSIKTLLLDSELVIAREVLELAMASEIGLTAERGRSSRRLKRNASGRNGYAILVCDRNRQFRLR